MSYFEHTKRDVREAREQGSRELAEILLALVDDSSRKMDTDYTDRQILLEDLITRVVMVAEAVGADASMFDSLENFRGANPLIPILNAHEFEAAHSPGSCTAMVTDKEGSGDVCGRGPGDPIHVASVTPITNAPSRRIKVWNGYPVHKYAGTEEWPGCTAQITSHFNLSAEPITCNFGKYHDIHKVEEQ